MSTSEGGFATPRAWRRIIDLGSPSSAIRLLVGLAVAGFLVYYVGFDVIGTTLLKVVVAVAVSIGLIVAFNLAFNMVYDRWAWFTTILGFAVGVVTLLVLDGNRVLRDLDPRPWSWVLIGGVAGGAVMFVLSAPRQSVARLPLAVIGLGGFGVLIAIAVRDGVQPALDWPKLLVCAAVGAGAAAALRLAGRRRDRDAFVKAALVGGAIGWLVGAWGGGELGAGGLGDALVATVPAFVAIGARLGIGGLPTVTERRQIEERSRSWIFVAPALLLVAAGLVIPLIRTIVLSFRDRNSEDFVGLQNYRDVVQSRRPAVVEEFIDAEDWFERLMGSRLWWVGVAVVGLALVSGLVGGRVRRQLFAAEPGSIVPMMIGFFLAACAVFATIRGTVSNNLWWIVVVTALSTSFGLAVAVLADRAKGENIAKSLIFLPMAISFVGAGIIWRFVYVTRNVSKPQTGLLNAIWVGLGELSNSDWQKWVVAAAVALVIVGLVVLAFRGVSERNGSRIGFSIGSALVLLTLLVLLLGPGLGGFETTPRGELRPKVIDFVREGPYNNMWLMVVLIWIQTGFAMVIFSSAIKAVPTELTEAARIDGATESQVFWKVTLPHISPTIGVVMTTLIVTVLKVFDIVRVTTGGQFGTQVIANQMANSITDRNAGIAATLATLLFVGVLPVMIYNLRQMQKAKA